MGIMLALLARYPTSQCPDHTRGNTGAPLSPRLLEQELLLLLTLLTVFMEQRLSLLMDLLTMLPQSTTLPQLTMPLLSTLLLLSTLPLLTMPLLTMPLLSTPPLLTMPQLFMLPLHIKLLPTLMCPSPTPTPML